VIDKNINANERSVTLIIYGQTLTDSLSRNIVNKKNEYGLGAADIVLKSSFTAAIQNDLQSEPKTTMNKELEKQLLDKDNQIQMLALKLKTQYQNQIKDSAIYHEFHALFGKTKELIISKAIDRKEDNKRDTLVLVYYVEENRTHKINRAQLENWLKVRATAKTVKVISN
jgi:hypothetical protein